MDLLGRLAMALALLMGLLGHGWLCRPPAPAPPVVPPVAPPPNPAGPDDPGPVVPVAPKPGGDSKLRAEGLAYRKALAAAFRKAAADVRSGRVPADRFNEAFATASRAAGERLGRAIAAAPDRTAALDEVAAGVEGEK